MRTNNMAEFVSFEELIQSVTGEEIRRSSSTVEDESSVALQVFLHLLRLMLRAGI